MIFKYSKRFRFAPSFNNVNKIRRFFLSNFVAFSDYLSFNFSSGQIHKMFEIRVQKCIFSKYFLKFDLQIKFIITAASDFEVVLEQQTWQLHYRVTTVSRCKRGTSGFDLSFRFRFESKSPVSKWRPRTPPLPSPPSKCRRKKQ